MFDRTYPLARKALFCLDAERAHHWSLAGLRLAERCGILEGLAGGPPAADPVEWGGGWIVREEGANGAPRWSATHAEGDKLRSRYLAEGELIESEMDGIGRLENRCVARA